VNLVKKNLPQFHRCGICF